MTKKLTKARREMLEDLEQNGPGYYVDYWEPVRWAIANSYIEEVKSRYRITPAGLSALAADRARTT